MHSFGPSIWISTVAILQGLADSLLYLSFTKSLLPDGLSGRLEHIPSTFQIDALLRHGRGLGEPLGALLGTMRRAELQRLDEGVIEHPRCRTNEFVVDDTRHVIDDTLSTSAVVLVPGANSVLTL